MEQTPQSNAPRNLWLVAAMLTGIAAALLVAFFLIVRGFDPQPGPPKGGSGGTTAAAKKLTREVTLKLLDQRARAVAHLENHEFEQAETLLLQIIAEVPNDPFGPRNLTVCRELWLGVIDATREPARQVEMLSKAREALELLAKVEPNLHVLHVLDARISIRAGEIDNAAFALRRASELAPKSAAVWYDLYSLKPAAPGESPSAETVAALRKVYELEPDNLFVLKDLLPLLVQLKDPTFAETAEKAKETLQPFADIIKTHARVNVLDLLDVVAKAAREGNWPLATGRTMAIRNVMVSESARDDRYVKLDSLEYVLQDFGPAFYERAEMPVASSGEGIPVSFALASQDQQPALPSGVRDLAAIDLDLDGRIDGVTLHEDRIVAVMPFSPKNADEKVSLVNAAISGDYRGLLAVDLDDDVDAKLKDRPKDAAGCLLADPDLIVFGPSGLKLFENRVSKEGQREFIEKQVGDALDSLRDVVDVVPADLDLDGDLDFFTIAADGIRLWSNRSNWTFEEITSRSKLLPANFAPTDAAACDWDKDSDLDIVVMCVNGLGVLENLRHGRFRWRKLDDGFEKYKEQTAILIEDVDGNGSWDVIGSGLHGLYITLTQITAGGVVTIKSSKMVGEDEVPFPPKMFDFNNDGYRDCVVRFNKWGVDLMVGSPDGAFSGKAPANNAWPHVLMTAKQFEIADIDRDGDEDIILVNRVPGSTMWLTNNGGNANGWLDVSLLAQQIKPNEQNYSKRVNHAGIGSTIELKAASKHQSQVVTGPITHFGLGPQKKADVVRVIWTNGVPRNLIDPEPNLHVCEEQKLVGSCPYLYTWDGEQFVFVTDLLWNSPIGLKFAETVVAPWREWEYLKIDGSKLKPKNGEYLLHITEELWEAGYFDQVKLFAIDHPAETDIYTNEKVGPASMAEHKLHTVRSPRIPVAAKDTHGRDVLEQVKARDGIYTKTYDRKLAQGLTTDHFLELDLGPWVVEGRGLSVEGQKTDKPSATNPANSSTLTPQPSTINLFLTGWIYPTSTSLNVQFSQNPDGPQPRPPALHAIDANGEWREVRPFMGFPGGKTKTIAIDISDVFAPGSTDHRLRIVTNMEFYWDAAFFTVNEAPVEVRQTELLLVRGDLHDRGGISFREYDAGNGPEYFHHNRLVPGLHWPPMAGSFTRFGDVRELLTERDDKLLVLGCNDEMSLAFAEPSEPLPAGWVRDFVIYNVGWDKDSDMNTVYGESVEPLPFRDMTVYAHRDSEPRPPDDEYVRYLKKYQTRTQSRPRFWNEVRQRSVAD
ncbi:MAG: FG-GAP-like repeat-containing protein [Planctomycetales bacterium]|nr:FG-GAP-like repeat-containing protein [Planctomycetales bacterium]